MVRSTALDSDPQRFLNYLTEAVRDEPADEAAAFDTVIVHVTKERHCPRRRFTP